MENPFDAVAQAVREAQELDRAIDRQTNTIAELLDGRLRAVSSWRLKRLKTQLQGFNARTGKWKD